MNELQTAALQDLCARYKVGFDPQHYTPRFDLPKGYFAGWIGGVGGEKIFVGVAPDGRISS